MLIFIIQRSMQAIIVMLFVSFVSFGLFQFIGDLVVATGGAKQNIVDKVTPESIMKNLYNKATKDFIQNLSIHMQEFADFIRLFQINGNFIGFLWVIRN